jgi:hypothetical protein
MGWTIAFILRTPSYNLVQWQGTKSASKIGTELAESTNQVDKINSKCKPHDE